MIKKHRQLLNLFIVLLITTLFLGCATTNIKHPMVVNKVMQPGDPEDFAYAYFIRPKPYKGKGISDEPITVEYHEEKLLTIGEGSYTLIRIKPSKGELKVNSRTNFVNSLTPVEVWRSRDYKFIQGKTYFIYLKRINEEYRGIYFDPQPISHQEAIKLVSNIHASGEARKSPVEKIKNVSEPPASAVSKLNPALPENIYKQERYLK